MCLHRPDRNLFNEKLKHDLIFCIPQKSHQFVNVNQCETRRTDEFVAVQAIVLGILYRVLHQLDGLIWRGCGMIRQAFQCHFLFGHQFARVLVHLCIVYAQTTEYGKCLDNRYIRIGEC